MQRRGFLIGTGAILSAAAFSAACGHVSEDPRSLSPLPQGSPPIVHALRYGITAPSAHNTQPWRIELVSDTQARLFFDPARMLPATDPPGRQVHISHGTLVEMTAIAATHLGYRTQVEVLPDGEMSLEQFGTKPTATLRLVKEAGQAVDPLFAQVLLRRSSRLPYEGPLVTAEELDALAAHASPDKVAVGLVPRARLPDALDIVKRAMTIEVEDFELYDETLRWFRFDDAEIEQHRDGLNFKMSGVSGAQVTMAKTFLNRRNWHKKRNLRIFLKDFTKTVDTTRGLLTLVTPSNTMADWIATGRVYLRAQLAANALGLRFHPVSQSLQEYPKMDTLRAQMNSLVGVEAPGKLQMLVRVGRSKTPGLSPRRHLDAIVS